MESENFRKQIMEMKNNRLDSERLNLCTLCGYTTRGCERKHNGVKDWIQGWVHIDCAEGIEKEWVQR